LNGKGLITQRISHILENIFCGHISECAACGRDRFAEGLDCVKTEKDRLER
jgi:hypothetical protein